MWIENPLRFGEFRQAGLLRILLLDGHAAESIRGGKMSSLRSLHVARRFSPIVETRSEAFRIEQLSHQGLTYGPDPFFKGII